VHESLFQTEGFHLNALGGNGRGQVVQFFFLELGQDGLRLMA
jgi:hypothetical protein